MGQAFVPSQVSKCVLGIDMSQLHLVAEVELESRISNSLLRSFFSEIVGSFFNFVFQMNKPKISVIHPQFKSSNFFLCITTDVRIDFLSFFSFSTVPPLIRTYSRLSETIILV